LGLGDGGRDPPEPRGKREKVDLAGERDVGDTVFRRVLVGPALGQHHSAIDVDVDLETKPATTDPDRGQWCNAPLNL
jgi:hypothetical protein